MASPTCCDAIRACVCDSTGTPMLAAPSATTSTSANAAPFQWRAIPRGSESSPLASTSAASAPHDPSPEPSAPPAGADAVVTREGAGCPRCRLVQVLPRDPEPLVYRGEVVRPGDLLAGYVRAGSYGFTPGEPLASP